MTRYGIADIGSNTVVLLVYEAYGTSLRNLKYISTPAHLIDDVKDGRMSPEGIRKASDILKGYAAILDGMEIEYRFADVTEPCRIENRDELIAALAESGFKVYPLTGKEEAMCDFSGATVSFPDLKDGIAFDVGGGSTELIRFENGEAMEAMSFHLGCVRLAHLPLDTKECRKELLKARKEYPLLDVQSDTVIGIGGTARAVGLLSEEVYGDRHRISTLNLIDLFERIRTGEETACDALKRVVEPTRAAILLFGMHMILEICAVFEAKEVLISETGIREGFLFERIRELSEEI